MKVVCTLTREQATLYQAVVNEELRRIESADGIERRGRVLALLTFTKQICNHPAQYLGETGPLPKRSGKLARTTEMLEEAVAAGDKALVFTQFREMGDKLVDHLSAEPRPRSCSSTAARRRRRATRWSAASRRSRTARASSCSR
jgi:SNF2 family DNA or RNA helicase